MIKLLTGQSGRFRWATLVLTVMCAACSPRHLIVQGLASELASQGQAPEDDLVLAREASAFYLKLSESLLREAPGNLALAEAVAGGFTQYAYAFVQFEAERLEARDARSAQQLRERAQALYRRAHRHAMTALEQHSPGLLKALSATTTTGMPPLRADQIGVAYWAAASWGALISLSKDDPDAVADLPAAMRLAGLAYTASPEHGAGALATLMGSFEASRPGGSRTLAEKYFDEAIHLGRDSHAGPLVAKAENIALAAGNRAAFELLLQQALRVSSTQRNLPNSVMRARALWLLENADDLF
jgi:hypothetical protein